MGLQYVVCVYDDQGSSLQRDWELMYEFTGTVSDKVVFDDGGTSHCLADRDETIGYYETAIPVPVKRIRDAVSCAVFETDAERKIDADSRAAKMAKHCAGDEWETANVRQKLRQIERMQDWIDRYDEAMKTPSDC